MNRRRAFARAPSISALRTDSIPGAWLLSQLQEGGSRPDRDALSNARTIHCGKCCVPSHAPAQANDLVLVLGSHRQSVSVVRALARQGWRVVLGQRVDLGTPWVGRSRYVAALWRHPAYGAPQNAFRDALVQYVVNERVRVIFPIGDTDIDAIDAIRDELPVSVGLVLPRSPTIRICRDKRVTMALAKTLGVPVAPYRVLSEFDPNGSFEGIGFPTVLKPISEQSNVFGRKAFIATCIDDVRDVARLHGSPVEPLIVQEFVSGSRFNVYFFATEGQVKAVLATRVLRTNRLDGTGYAVDCVTAALPTHWSDHLERLVAEIRYHGAGCFQFIRDDATGRETFLEINSRLGANYRSAERFGLALPVWWVSQTVAAPPEIPASFTYPLNKHISWFLGDLQGLGSALAEGGIRPGTALGWGLRTIRTLFRWHHLTWSWRDPLPSPFAFAGFLKNWVRRIAAGRATLLAPAARHSRVDS